MTDPFPMDIPPGVVLTQSNLGQRGRWNRSSHVRFVNGRPEKIGGWEDRCPGETVTGLARGAYGWMTAAHGDLIATGTSVKLYSISDALQDITPLRASGTLEADPFAVTSGSAIVRVTHANHGMDDGATAIFSGATAGGGITIAGEYVITLDDSGHYFITHTAVGTSNDSTTGGGAVAYKYEINPGEVSSGHGLGWGAGTWGESTWGTPRDSSGIVIDPRVWCFDRYGTELLCNYTNGQIFLWDEPNADERAVAIVNSPECRSMFLTGERFIFALGTTTAMTIQWPDRDDITNWTPGDAVEADIRVLQDGNQLMAGCLFNDAINVIWSDTAIYRAQYIPGATFIYDIAVIATECGLISQDSYENTPVGVVWMSASDFFIYNGQVTVIPNRQDIKDWVFAHLQKDQSAKIWCCYNPKHNEVWWGFPSLGSAEPDFYVKCVLDGYSWDVGPIDRTTMAAQRTAVGDLVGLGVDRKVYTHEVGKNADGAALEAYVGHGMLSISSGDTDEDVFAYQPDFERQVGEITLFCEIFDRPDDLAPLETDTVTIAEGQGVADLNLGGRYVRTLLRSNTVDGDFRTGLASLELGVGGEE